MAARTQSDASDAAGGPEPSTRAWMSWLGALANDADAALAASIAYESLDDAGRDAWLDALDQDGPRVHVPPVALYAPLLAVEHEGPRRARIASSMGPDAWASATGARAHVGGTAGHRICLIAVPLYLSFVEVLVCHYGSDCGVRSAIREPMRHEADLASLVPDASLAPAPLGLVVDELAHAVLADRREGRDAPGALSAFAHLFGLRHAGWDYAA